jgi:carbonic anhydrase
MDRSQVPCPVEYAVEAMRVTDIVICGLCDFGAVAGIATG